MDKDNLPITKDSSQERPFSALHREIDRVFNDFSRGFPVFGRHAAGVQTPKMDVKDVDGEIEVTVELPGMSEKDFEVSVECDRLTVSGEKKSESKREEDDYRIMERSYGKFTRSVTLQFEPDPDKVKARFDKGVLTLVLPKPPEQAAKAKKIVVKSK